MGRIYYKEKGSSRKLIRIVETCIGEVLVEPCIREVLVETCIVELFVNLVS